jgi:hypothetical protein
MLYLPVPVQAIFTLECGYCWDMQIPPIKNIFSHAGCDPFEYELIWLGQSTENKKRNIKDRLLFEFCSFGTQQSPIQSPPNPIHATTENEIRNKFIIFIIQAN